jgi:hypothetical protein
MATEIIETPTHRIVGNHVFIKHTEKGTPPPELVAEVAAENLKAEREALLTPMESPIATAQRDLDEARRFEENIEPFVGSVWVEKNPPPNGETVKFEINNFFRGIRPNVMGEATKRDEFLIRVAVTPFIATEPEKPRIETRGGRKRIFEAVAATPTIEKFPLAFFTLSEFLQKHQPEKEFDITVLEVLAEPDAGHEHEKWIEQPKPPTVEESIARLVSALTAAQKPAMP